MHHTAPFYLFLFYLTTANRDQNAPRCETFTSPSKLHKMDLSHFKTKSFILFQHVVIYINRTRFNIIILSLFIAYKLYLVISFHRNFPSFLLSFREVYFLLSLNLFFSLFISLRLWVISFYISSTKPQCFKTTAFYSFVSF